MTKLNLLLLVAIIASAMMLVRTAYDSRRLFAELHRAEIESARLAGETKRLEAEREAQATSLRVERTARERLAMRTISPAITVYAVDPQAKEQRAAPEVLETLGGRDAADGTAGGAKGVSR